MLQTSFHDDNIRRRQRSPPPRINVVCNGILCGMYVILHSILHSLHSSSYAAKHSKCHHIWCNFLTLISIFCHSFIGLLYFVLFCVRNGGGGRGGGFVWRNGTRGVLHLLSIYNPLNYYYLQSILFNGLYIERKVISQTILHII